MYKFVIANEQTAGIYSQITITTYKTGKSEKEKHDGKKQHGVEGIIVQVNFINYPYG